MNLVNYYYYFKKALSPKFCNEVLQFAKQKQEQIATTGFLQKENLSKKELKDLKKKRDSNIIWLNDDWIYREIHPYIHEANKQAGWNFEWDWSESCQFTKYSKGQYYGWHRDSWEAPYNNINDLNFHGKIRKLSVTCSLSDSSKYKGGELEFNFNNPELTKKQNIRECKEILSQGSICVFPSFVWHRVKPVTKGIRYSLVLWNLGYSFK
jgi:PKHD-type hydroxylase